MESAVNYLTKFLKLKVNLNKSAVDRPCNRKFLGFSFGQGAELNHIKVHGSRIKRFKDGVKEIIKKAKGNKLLRIIEKEIVPKTRGWINYFSLANESRLFGNLDSWIRRRIRCALWKQWKTSKKRFKELIKLGSRRKDAKNIAFSGKGAWRISSTRCMHTVLGNKVLENMGLMPMMKMMRA